MSYGREVIFGWFAGTRAWIIKPFMFQECLNIVINWVRLYLVFGLAHLNPFSLIICFTVFYAVLYIEISIFNWGVLRGRPDLQVPIRTILIFPMYVFLIHVGGTRCVTSSTDNIMKIRARITLIVEFIRGYIFIFLFYV